MAGLGGERPGWRREHEASRIRKKVNKGYSNPITMVSFTVFLSLDHSEKLMKMLHS